MRILGPRRVPTSGFHFTVPSLYLFFLGTLHIFVLGSLARLGLFAASYLLPQLPALYLSGTHGRRRQMPAFEPQADASVRVITRLGRKMHHRVPPLGVSRGAAMATQLLPLTWMSKDEALYRLWKSITVPMSSSGVLHNVLINTPCLSK